jgi:regulator of protease activity HflC (stomatin/prohibitin superfamily)
MSNTEFQAQLRQAVRELRPVEMSMPSFLQLAVFVLLLGVTGVLSATAGGAHHPQAAATIFISGAIISGLVAASLKVANQWERAMVLRLGEFKGLRGPGLFFIVPIIDRVRMIDTRIKSLDIRRQEVITRDNVPVTINGALFFRVENAEYAVLKIQDYLYAISLLAQTALRDVVGGMSLDDLLAERERIGKQIEAAVETDSREWGLEVTGIRLQDIDMPEDLKKIMSRQAAAEREKRATITKAEGDKLASENLAAAAANMRASPGAMQLRTLQTIDGLGPTASNTVVLAIPTRGAWRRRRRGRRASEQALLPREAGRARSRITPPGG